MKVHPYSPICSSFDWTVPAKTITLTTLEFVVQQCGWSSLRRQWVMRLVRWYELVWGSS